MLTAAGPARASARAANRSTIAAPPSTVFEVLTDHRGYSAFSPIPDASAVMRDPQWARVIAESAADGQALLVSRIQSKLLRDTLLRL